jgi:hypothetical protein
LNDDDTPAWSPDGTKIAFRSDRDGPLEVYVMNADGSGQTNLTGNSSQNYAPDWQPLVPPAQLAITNLGQYALPKTCFQVRNSAQTPVFQVCDNDFAGTPVPNAACAGDGVCNDEDAAQGAVKVSVSAADYRIVESVTAPNHTSMTPKQTCDATTGQCTVTFINAPNTRPWHPWDINNDGFVRTADIVAVVMHYGMDKPLPTATPTPTPTP